MRISGRMLQFFMVGVAAFYFLAAGGRAALHDSKDFAAVYSGARCLLKGCNAYDPAELRKQYLQNGGVSSEAPNPEQDPPVLLPSTLFTLSTFALLRFPAAKLLWTVVNSASFILAAAVVIYACPELYGWLTCALVSLFLITARTPLTVGQPGILSISLLIVGAILFLQGRYLRLATVLLIVSLAAKPQIGGLIVLYFLIRKIRWRYAAAACAGAAALLAIGVLMLQAHPASANWLADLHANATASLSPGAANDPRPTSPESISEVNLQALTSVFFEDSTAFNVAALGIFLGLVIAWAVTTLQAADSSPGIHYVELAAIAVLSLMPVYHRSHDTRLLLLTIPAIPIVLERKRSLGLLVFIVTPLATLPFVQYRIQEYLQSHGQWQAVFQHRLLFAVLVRNEILALVLLFFLYLAAIIALRRPADEGTSDAMPKDPVAE